MHLRILIGNGLQQTTSRIVDKNARFALRTHVNVAGLVAVDCAVSATEFLPRPQLSPAVNDIIGPLSIPGAGLSCAAFFCASGRCTASKRHERRSSDGT